MHSVALWAEYSFLRKKLFSRLLGNPLLIYVKVDFTVSKDEWLEALVEGIGKLKDTVFAADY